MTLNIMENFREDLEDLRSAGYSIAERHRNSRSKRFSKLKLLLKFFMSKQMAKQKVKGKGGKYGK